MIRRFPVPIALVVPALLASIPAPAAAQREGCLALEGRLSHPDSLVVTVATARCGPLRLEVTGPARRLAERPAWKPGATHEWAVPVAVVNAGTEPIELPVRLQYDSIVALQRGRRLTRAASGPLIDARIREAPEHRLSWRFDGPAGATVLRPGQRATRTLWLATHVLTQGFRVAMSPREHTFRIASDAEIEKMLRRDAPPDTTAPLPIEVARFVAATGFPEGARPAVILRDAARRITVFGVNVREPGCGRGVCYHYQAVGVQHGGRIGWIYNRLGERFPEVTARIEAARFTPSAREDAELFTLDFLARVQAGSRPWGAYASSTPDVNLRPLLMRAPGAPRAFLRSLAERLYEDEDGILARYFPEVPDLRDPGVLTLLADVPGSYPPYDSLRTFARERLLELAPSLAADPSTSAATLFAVARALEGPDAAALAARLADHPNARTHPAILAVLHGHAPALAPRVLAAVRAPEPQKRRLAMALGAGGETAAARAQAARKLAGDPSAAEDALAVLANLDGDDDLRMAAWLASRRLPETAFRRWEGVYVPRR